MKFTGVMVIIPIVIIILSLMGWVKCIIKLSKTDFQAPYKAEVIYGIGTFTGAGAIIGWINIKD